MVATALGEFGAEVIKVEPPGVRRPDADLGCCAATASAWCGRASAGTSAASRSTCARTEGQELFHELLDVSDVLIVGNRPERARAVGHRLGVRARRPPARRDVSRQRLRQGRTGERPARLRHAGRGDERLRAAGRPTRRATDAAAVHARRRRRGSWPPTYAVTMALYHRDVHGGERPAGRREPDRAAGPADGVEHAGATTSSASCRQRVGNRLDASAPRNAYRTSDDRWLAISSASPTIAVRVYRAIGRDDLAEDPDYVDPDPTSGSGGRGRRARRRLDPRPAPSTRR